METKQSFWTCIIGPASQEDLDMFEVGVDFPIRQAVQKKYMEMMGHPARVCISGWDSATEEIARQSLEKSFVYAVKDTCLPKPELRELTSGELLKLLTNYAKNFASLPGGSQSSPECGVVDFINYIGANLGINYGLMVDDLKKEKYES